MVADSLPRGAREAALLAGRDRLTAFVGVEVADYADAGGLTGSGLSNPGHWLAHHADLSQTQGRSIIATGRLAKRFDAVAEGISEGVLTSDHLTVLKKCLPRNRTRYRAEAFDDHHKMMIDLARELDFPSFKKACAAWVSLADDADPDVTAPEEQDLGIDFTDNGDGTTNIKGLILTTDALLLKEGLIRIAEQATQTHRQQQQQSAQDPAVEGSAGAGSTGEGPTGEGPAEDGLGVDYSISEYTLRPVIRRGRRYWMARALGMIANKANTAPKDGTAPDPLLVVMFDSESFETAKHAYTSDEPELPADIVFRPGYQCETLDGQPINPLEAFRIALNHRIARCVINTTNRRVDLGRTSRLFTGAARQAIIYRDRTCTTPGCRKPGRTGQIDHIKQWQHGGTTDTHNGQLLCPEHHHHKTRTEAQQQASEPF